ncbi:MAG TPA: hypothetical protein VEQ87_03745 [Burkholderiales bacterium]|nr:hypothetical protein [Burkholderiales bacterium]
MIRVLAALAFVAFVSPAQATCLFARDSKPQDWYDWAAVLVAADVTAIEPQARVDVISLRAVETFKGPVGAEIMTLQVPNNLWEACRLERPAIGARVLGALNANNDALVVPLSASYAEQMRAARPGPAIPIASQNITPAPAPVAAAPAATPAAAAAAAAPAARCVATPVYGATVKVEQCEQAAGALFLRGELLRVARENSVPAVEGLPVPTAGQRYLFFKPSGRCQDFGKNPALTGRLSHPCCDANQPYCARKADFLVDDGPTPPSAPAPKSK